MSKSDNKKPDTTTIIKNGQKQERIRKLQLELKKQVCDTYYCSKDFNQRYLEVLNLHVDYHTEDSVVKYRFIGDSKIKIFSVLEVGDLGVWWELFRSVNGVEVSKIKKGAERCQMYNPNY